MFAIGALAAASAARASFVTIVGPTGALCSASAQCYPPSNCDYLVEDLELEFGHCLAYSAQVEFLSSESEAFVNWYASGYTEYIVHGDVRIFSEITASGMLLPGEVLNISGSYDLAFVYFMNRLGYTDVGSAEISVIRFAADPAQLLGLRLTSARDLVSAGLIEATDILHLKNDSLDFPSSSMDFSFDVDVTGVDYGHLFLFVTAQSVLPEPEQLLMLASGVAILAGLHRCRKPPSAVG
jgi:hypothetical protein